MKHIKLFVLPLFFQTALALAASSNDASHRWWINLGVGVGTKFNHTGEGSNFGPAGQLSFNGMITDHLFITLQSTGFTGGSGDDDSSNGDAGILLGYKCKKPNWYWSTAAGISYFRTEYYETVTGQYYNYNYSYRYWYEQKGIGIPLEAQLFWTPIKHFGIGIIGHGVISKVPSTVAMLAIQIS